MFRFFGNVLSISREFLLAINKSYKQIKNIKSNLILSAIFIQTLHFNVYLQMFLVKFEVRCDAKK